jgi:hypothetical protein
MIHRRISGLARVGSVVDLIVAVRCAPWRPTGIWQLKGVGVDTVRRRAGSHLNSFLKRYGFELIPSGVVYDWQRLSSPLSDAPSHQNSVLPEGAREYLRPDNPRLTELQKRYNACDSRVTAPMLWTDDLVKSEDILTFRADNAYVWQGRGPNMHETAYALTEVYVRSIDNLGLLDKLTEDELFGAATFTFDKKIVSRDLLDSILEIYFLERHLGLFSRANTTVLDIGAGYGRLAHRVATAVPGIQTYFATDAVAVSTFICEYYLRFRGLGDKARVVPLDEVENTIADQPADIALNIHSFSECAISAIDWWLSLLERRNVKYLMVAPNTGDHKGEKLLTNDGKDFGEVIRRHGYELIAKDPKFADPIVQKHAINPTYHYLFELQNSQPG